MIYHNIYLVKDRIWIIKAVRTHKCDAIEAKGGHHTLDGARLINQPVHTVHDQGLARCIAALQHLIG